MPEKNDWRLQGQEKYLMNATLVDQSYEHPVQWDHDHCAFCWKKFSETANLLHRGYHSVKGGHWICEQCFEDFKEMFHFEMATE